VVIIMSGKPLFKKEMDSLEDMSPEDERFLAAIKNTDQVLPATILERQAIEVSRSNVDEAFNEKRYQDAQEMSTLADAAKAVLDEKDAVFEIVRRCLKDARACVTMERSAKAFVLAGAWQDIAEKLAHRLESFGASKAAGDGLFSPPKRAPPVVSSLVLLAQNTTGAPTSRTYPPTSLLCF
jgi:hypothetical protein